MFGRKEKEEVVKSPTQLATELNTALESFIKGWVDSGLPAGTIFDCEAVPRVFVQYLYGRINIENLKRLPENQAILRQPAVKYNAQRFVETRRELTTQERTARAQALRRRQIEDSTAMPCD
jgi:hypothetical protein